jgi:hypothetical protein
VCADCISSKHNEHKFEPIETILPEKMDELKGAEARYSKDLTLCRAKVEEFQIGENKYESLCDIECPSILSLFLSHKDHKFLRFVPLNLNKP